MLHWSMAAILLFLLALGIWMANFVPDLIERFRLTQLHKSWGAVAFALALLRLGWRAVDRPRPALPAATPPWQRRAARASHVLLYALMILMPVSGWVMASASPLQETLGMTNEVFGLFALPDPWVPGVEPLSDAARSLHVAAALTLMAVLALHVGAALKHHLIDRDRVLRGMLRGPEPGGEGKN